MVFTPTRPPAKARATCLSLVHESTPQSTAVMMHWDSPEAGTKADGSVRFGHASGAIEVGAQAERAPEGHWRIRRVSLSRSARRLMVGAVCVPAACFEAAPANSTNKEQ